jgi:hypothetical protein
VERVAPAEHQQQKRGDDNSFVFTVEEQHGKMATLREYRVPSGGTVRGIFFLCFLKCDKKIILIIT